MANPYVEYTADGVDDIFSVPFPYLHRSHVRVLFNGVIQISNYTWANASNLHFNTPPAVGTLIRIERVTPTAPLVTYQPGAALTVDELNTSNRQQLYLYEEAAAQAATFLDRDGVEELIEEAALGGADTFIRQDLASTTDAAKGSALIGHSGPYITPYLQTLSDIQNGSEVSIMRFVPNTPGVHAAIRDGSSILELHAAFQSAFDAANAIAGINLMIPSGVYNLQQQVLTNHEGIHLRGVGRPILKIGEGQAAGYHMLQIGHGNFSASGLRFESQTKSHTFYVQSGAEELRNFSFIDNEFDGCFYAVRCDGTAAAKISDVLIAYNRSTAPQGTNAGHFLVDYGNRVRMIGNSIRYGSATAGYGVSDTTNFAIIGNTETDLEDTAGGAEAACQAEDCDGANGIIAGNSFQNDIWIAGSNNVAVTGNTCRRMRCSVGNSDGHDVREVIFSGNKAAAIYVEKFGSTTPPERITARYIGNILDPSGVLINGNPISQAVYINTAWVNEVVLKANDVVSAADTNAVVLSRPNALATVRLIDNDFGSRPHQISNASGKVYERGNRNGLYVNDGGYVSVQNIAGDASPTLNAWTEMTFDQTAVNVNSEWGFNVFTAKEAGVYRFSGIVTVTATGSGNEAGFRIYRTNNTPAEMARLAYAKASAAGNFAVVLRTVELQLQAGDSVRLEYFLTGASTQIVGGATVTEMQIHKVS